MSFEVEIKGLRQLAKTLDSLPDVTRRHALKVLRDASAPVVSEAKRLAPRSALSKPHMADSIKARTRTKKGVTRLEIGPDKQFFYARFQEYGTRHHAARPFLRPAADTKGEQAVQAAISGFWALAAKHWEQG